MISVDRASMNLHIMSPRHLTQQFPTPLTNIAAKHVEPALRRPDEVVFAVPDSVAATRVVLHPRMLMHPVA